MKPVNLYRLIYGHVPISTADTVEPVIPQNRLPTENSLLPRICVSKTLDGCLTAIGPSIIGIRTLLNQFPSKEGTTPSLRNNKEAKLMFPFTVLRFDIPANSSYLIRTRDVSKLVADAWKTDECWLVKPCTPSCVSHLWLVDGIVELSSICHNNHKYPYYQVSNSVWSEQSSYATQKFSKEIIKTVDRYLQ